MKGFLEKQLPVSLNIETGWDRDDDIESTG
jgi:hypothetical protein